MPRVSIVIINTNNKDVTLQCLESVYATASNLDIETFVVNNACKDGSGEAISTRFPMARVIENRELLGFSSNNNLAFSQASGEYLLELNDDAILQPGALEAMVTFMDENPGVAVVGARLLNSDGTDQLSYDRSPHPLYEAMRPLSTFLLPLPSSSGSPLEVDNVCAACMLVRASAAQSIGYLDTRFDPIYSDEVDWCLRFKRAGWKIYHLPAARVIHLGSYTMNRAPLRRVELLLAHKALFFRKHYGEGAAAFYKAALFVSNLGKSVFWSLLWVIGRGDAGHEAKLHWTLQRRILFL